MRLMILSLIISMMALAQKPDKEGQGGNGGAGGGSFRGLEIVKRIPASVSFYNKEIPIIETSSLSEAKKQCEKIEGVIVGTQSLPGMHQHCFTFYCSKNLSEGLSGKYLATYGYCGEPQKIENVVSKEFADNHCKEKNGFIFSSLISFKNGQECNIYRCSEDAQADEMGQFISQYRACNSIKKTEEDKIKSLVISKDKKTIHLNGQRYTISPLSNTREISKEAGDLSNATNQ